MAEFKAGLPALNAIADAAPGFVWRLVDDGGADATALRPFGDDTMVNMSVWESVEALRDYTYRMPQHLEALRRRREWFQPFPAPTCWCSGGSRPARSRPSPRREKGWRCSTATGRGPTRSPCATPPVPGARRGRREAR